MVLWMRLFLLVIGISGKSVTERAADSEGAVVGLYSIRTELELI